MTTDSHGEQPAADSTDKAVLSAKRRKEPREVVAVAGWRDCGFSDSQIGRELGVTKQAVQQRWPR